MTSTLADQSIEDFGSVAGRRAMVNRGGRGW